MTNVVDLDNWRKKAQPVEETEEYVDYIVHVDETSICPDCGTVMSTYRTKQGNVKKCILCNPDYKIKR